jgi:hypothetical protein
MEKIRKLLSENLLGVLIAFGVLSITYCVFVDSSYMSMIEYIVIAIFMVVSSYKYKDNKLAEEKLKKRGLSIADISNIDFVKNWEENRKKGFIKYCLVDGGIITGMILLIPVSFISFMILNKLIIAPSARIFDEFGDMLIFIGCCFIISYVFGLHSIHCPLATKRMALSTPY